MMVSRISSRFSKNHCCITRRWKKTIAVAMSGGIDSSVTALLLKEQGFDVVGVFMRNWDFSDEKGKSECTYTRDRKDMEDVCRTLDIPAVFVDFSKNYWNEVFMPFLQAYQSGLETPNPDVYCNRYVKFKAFKHYVNDKLGIEDLATGHYARIKHITTEEGKTEVNLLTAADPTKDQTYFLALTNGDSLRNIHFPIGDLTKKQVKEIAKEKLPSLNILTKKESMGICFIGKRDMKDFLSEYIQYTPGRFIDIDTGKIISKHDKQEYYTIGQGAKISAAPHPYFVIDKISNINKSLYEKRFPDLHKGDILIGGNHDHPSLFSYEIFLPLQSFNWINGRFLETLKASDEGLRIRFKTRHTSRVLYGKLRLISSESKEKEFLKLEFEKPERAVTPGQILVLYNNEECLGGAPIPVLFSSPH